MDHIKGHFEAVSDVLAQTADGLSDYVGLTKQKIYQLLDEVEPFVNKVKDVGVDDILRDFRELRLTPITASFAITAVTSFIIISRHLTSEKNSKKKPNNKKASKKKKKLTEAQKINRDIQQILDFVEDEYVPKMDEYLENYSSLSREDIEYKYRYFEEMLLKELMKLDGIDIAGNEVLRDNRRKVIKFIQDHQKRLDAFKKEVKLDL
ncbi:Piso0_000655 [Millerozyma farinosa CBS 7064]|uniref:Piso0_000655 protein n=1 Tax=Pichia sorbitophila (strain ATCC MYA-4447 / BCRC 22081 / CBS 7064 / NBRC 10061 / NRRL Y-12695) TaxID=559304 RepID=G8YR55_PICSO|nr:Piso0_000655 [Millerozyma farinosa CBS 7064]